MKWSVFITVTCGYRSGPALVAANESAQPHVTTEAAEGCPAPVDAKFFAGAPRRVWPRGLRSGVAVRLFRGNAKPAWATKAQCWERAYKEHEVLKGHHAVHAEVIRRLDTGASGAPHKPAVPSPLTHARYVPGKGCSHPHCRIDWVRRDNGWPQFQSDVASCARGLSASWSTRPWRRHRLSGAWRARRGVRQQPRSHNTCTRPWWVGWPGSPTAPSVPARTASRRSWRRGPACATHVCSILASRAHRGSPARALARPKRRCARPETMSRPWGRRCRRIAARLRADAPRVDLARLMRWAVSGSICHASVGADAV